MSRNVFNLLLTFEEKLEAMNLVFMFLQDVSGSNEAGGSHRKIHVSLYRSLHVGGCRAAREGDGGKSPVLLVTLMIHVCKVIKALTCVRRMHKNQLAASRFFLYWLKLMYVALTPDPSFLSLLYSAADLVCEAAPWPG